jgi:hypothetical protein
MSETKLKVFYLTTISTEWNKLYSHKIENVNDINSADYIIFESNGDPINLIEHIKNSLPKNKLVFILSGDQSNHIDNECIWFTNAVKSSGLAEKQTQIFVTNPAIFKFYGKDKDKDKDKEIVNINSINSLERKTDIYFKGTIWDGMRTDMYNEFSNKPNCSIIKNNNYWKWRCESAIKPTQTQLEDTAFDSYFGILNSKLCLCPKGNGNSSMRIIEALACGAIPILINDFSSPFDILLNKSAIALVFDTNKHNWTYIYNECVKLINNEKRLKQMQQNGLEYFNNIVYGDSKLEGFEMYKNIDTVCFGFSNLIIDKLISMKNSNK